ncbi:acetyl-CoA synthetase-like protein [Martensiomyces pterosporus]|nr:acetyl-CoA synthetase-like protein [Martensiomyces pterosporus]
MQMYVASPLQPSPLPIGDIPTHIFRSAEPQRDEVVLIDAATDRQFTIGDIISTSNRLAAGLVRNGFKDGVVSVFDDCDLRCVSVYYAALLAGGTYQSLGTNVTDEKLRDRIVSSGTPVIFSSTRYLSRLREASQGLDIAICVFDCDNRDSGNAMDQQVPQAQRYVSFDDLLVDDPSFVPVRITSKDDAMRKPAYIAYSPNASGSSPPVMLSHYGLLSSQNLTIRRPVSAAYRTAVSAVPFSNTHGIGKIAHYPMLSGSRVVQLSQYDPAACLAALEKYEAGILLATHDVLFRIFAAARREGDFVVVGDRAFDIKPLKVIFLREMRMSSRFKEQVSELFRARMVELYEYMETGLIAGMITENPRVDDSVGILCPNVTARVVLDGKDVEDGECGEILVSTPRLMNGSPKQEAPGRTNADPVFFHTGDYGRVTRDGVVIIRARLSDVIRTQSGVVVPADIESRIMSHEHVADCAAIAVKRYTGRDGGCVDAAEVPHVFIVPAVDAASVSNIISTLENLYPGVSGQFVDSIPKGTTGETKRPELRAMLDIAAAE